MPDERIVYVTSPPRTSSFGVTALVLGVLSLLFCWIPGIGLVVVPIAALGLLFAIIGFFVSLSRNGAGMGYVIAGGILSFIPLIVPIIIVTIIGVGIAGAIEDAERKAGEQQAAVAARQDGPREVWQPPTEAPVLRNPVLEERRDEGFAIWAGNEAAILSDADY